MCTQITYQLCYTCCGGGLRFWALLVPGCNVTGSQVVADVEGQEVRGLRLSDTLRPEHASQPRAQVLRMGLFMLRVMAAQQHHINMELVLFQGRTRVRNLGHLAR